MARREGWFTARRSSDVGNCVEARIAAGAIHVRDSKARHVGTVTFTHDKWRDFVRGVRDGDVVTDA